MVTPPERRRSMMLSDGRKLAWSEWGPADGIPVLFCSGAALSGWLGFGAGPVQRLGVRLIGIDRPGLGKSSPNPTATLASWNDDVSDLIAGERLVDPLAIGFSQGAPFALALAARNTVRGVAIVSGQDELTHRDIAPMLQPEVARFVEAIRQDPEGFEQWFRGVATADGMWDLIISMSSEHDRRVYLEPEFSAAFRQALREGFEQGPDGYVRDTVNAVGPWLPSPEQIAVPVDLWYGALDTSTTHSPDFGTILARRLPNAQRTLCAGEGGSMLWTLAGDILERLLERQPVTRT